LETVLCISFEALHCQLSDVMGGAPVC